MKQSSYAIGIDVGGTSLKCGPVDQNGGVSYSFLFPLINVTTECEIIALINAAIRYPLVYFFDIQQLAMPGTGKYTEVNGALLGNKAGLLGCGGRVFSMFSTK